MIMSKLDELRKLLTLNAAMKTSDIEARFAQIAKLLFNSFAIEHENSRYFFKEIEFYFYNQHHQDIITHPRSSKALRWYVNDFGGIDLNFESSISTTHTIASRNKSREKYQLDEHSFFGGILIRKLQSEDCRVLDGPMACAKLFRCFDAASHNSGLPCLIERDNGNVAYICEPRVNILPDNKIPEEKVKSIISSYAQPVDVDKLTSAFSSFKDKRYRYVRCEPILHDSQTNEVYFSPWLNHATEGHPEFYNRLKNMLHRLGITTKELKCTNDYWVRDFMPIQLGTHEYFKYVYKPDYLVKTQEAQYITDCNNVIRGMGLNCRKTNLVIDGGNMVACGPYVVMTTKIFQENQAEYDKNSDEFIRKLESELGHPVIIIPWTMHGHFDAEETDKYGHSDGFIKWCGGNHILMGNHGDEYHQEAKEIRQTLEKYGFEVTEMRFNDKVASPHPELNWAYINFLQVGQHIILPSFSIDEDGIAYKYVQDAFPDCEIHPIRTDEIVNEGGALHCISWNIQA